MPIELFTGQPGNGKTALAMERLMQEAEKGERPIFACGIDGLKPGLATVLDDPRRWNDVVLDDDGPCECRSGDLIERDYKGVEIRRTKRRHRHDLVPDGSLVFVDEAWKWFGHLHDATRQATPEHVLALAEHRHRGLDFIWTTQQPNQLYPFVRGLIGTHHHVVRRFGTRFIDVFTWGELNEEVKSSAKRELAQRSTRTLPAKVFDAYKSAEVHTIKARLPWKVMAVPVVLVGAVVAAWLAVSMLRPDAVAERITGKEAPNAAGAASGQSGVPVSQSGGREPRWPNRTDYARDHLPRFGSMPWTAPVYDGRGITADPQLFCMSSMGGRGADGKHREPSCTCLTEQGTRYELTQPECRTVARHGQPYNPYKQHRDNDRPTGNAIASAEVPGV